MADSTAEKQSLGNDQATPDSHDEKRKQSVFDIDTSARSGLNAVFENPLAGVPDDQLMRDVEEFCQKYDLMDDLDDIKKGAMLSKYSDRVQEVDFLSDDEKEIVIREKTHKWDHPYMLYWLCVMCSLAAATQGMDETANNGALPIYPEILGITVENLGSQSKVDNIRGLIVSAPYLACAVLGCWLTEPLNRVFARRGTIFISCLIAALASIWEGVVQSWPNLFVARFVLGLGIGAKSSTGQQFQSHGHKEVRY
ncbi:hypothetical protein ACLMJK_008165 [Lecanora helva]